nr:uncharacterized protein LOC126537982 isoform X3 [Dermacentor andersoni]
MRRIAQPRIERCMAFCYAGFFVLFFVTMVVEDARERRNRNRSESVTIVFVICKNQYDDGLIAVKSAIAYSKSPMRIIIITDDIGQKDMLKEVFQLMVLSSTGLRSDQTNGWFVARRDHKACSRRHPSSTAPGHVQLGEHAWTVRRAGTVPCGMTSGLVLMNLTRMRELGLEQRLTELDRETAAPGRRGDMLSNLFTGRPEALRTFSCCWHFHSGHCNGSALCIDGPVAAVRGSQQVPAFAALRDSMRQYVLGGSLEKEFVAPLSARLDSMMPSNCSMHFKRQLPIWLQVARHVDNESVPITLDRNLLRFQHPPLPGQ